MTKNLDVDIDQSLSKEPLRHVIDFNRARHILILMFLVPCQRLVL